MNSDIESLKQQLTELKSTVEENHRLLLGIHRRARLATLFGVAKWTVIIGVSIGAFYYIQPFLETMLQTYTSISGLGGAGTIPEQSQILELLKNLK